MIKTVHGAMRMYIQQEQFCRQNEAYFKPWYLYQTVIQKQLRTIFSFKRTSVFLSYQHINVPCFKMDPLSCLYIIQLGDIIVIIICRQPTSLVNSQLCIINMHSAKKREEKRIIVKKQGEKKENSAPMPHVPGGIGGDFFFSSNSCTFCIFSTTFMCLTAHEH